MWHDEKVKNTPRKRTIELDEKLTDSNQKTMFGGLRADGKKSLSNTKKNYDGWCSWCIHGTILW